MTIQSKPTMFNFLKTVLDCKPTCFAKNKFGTNVRSSPREQDLFFSINKLHPYKDLKPENGNHKPDLARRADHNVIELRNFLIELDGLPLEEQEKIVEDRIPFTSKVYSGGKSYHYIISLEEPVSAEKWKEIVLRLHKLIPEADSSTKNPSRLSRLPFRYRWDTKKKQELLELRGRIKLEALEALLPTIELDEPRSDAPSASMSRFAPVFLLRACTAPDDVMSEVGIEGRNAYFFWLGNRLKEVYSDRAVVANFVNKAYNNLGNKTDFSLSEAKRAARV